MAASCVANVDSDGPQVKQSASGAGAKRAAYGVLPMPANVNHDEQSRRLLILVRIFTGMVVLGIFSIVGGVVLGLCVNEVNEAGVTGGILAVGLGLVAFGIRGRRRTRHLTLHKMSSKTDLVRRWHQLEIANTLAGIVVSGIALALIPEPVAAVLVAFSVLGAAMTWHLGNRLRRTGYLYRARKGSEGSSLRENDK
jgi:hypothetical protein